MRIGSIIRYRGNYAFLRMVDPIDEKDTLEFPVWTTHTGKPPEVTGQYP